VIPGLLRIGVSLTLLALLAWWLDAGALLERLARFDPRWALVAIAISLPQVALLAFPWRFTAGRLGLDLPFGAALQEYYLTNFLNQVLPGGVMGNVSRAWRHGRVAPKHPIGSAARAVILERVSAKVVMGGVAALSFASLPLTFGAMPATLTLAVCGVGGAALVVGTSLPTYGAAARAMGVSTPLWTLLPLSAPVLLSMLVPATGSVGCGVREATVAVLWGAVELTVVDGVAISAANGILVLLSSLPGGPRPAQRRSRSKRRSSPRGT